MLQLHRDFAARTLFDPEPETTRGTEFITETPMSEIEINAPNISHDIYTTKFTTHCSASAAQRNELYQCDTKIHYLNKFKLITTEYENHVSFLNSKQLMVFVDACAIQRGASNGQQLVHQCCFRTLCLSDVSCSILKRVRMIHSQKMYFPLRHAASTTFYLISTTLFRESLDKITNQTGYNACCERSPDKTS
ncbi:Hypothetical_protein [Hexamita inflata]|uniref:Hypothetical_protein n=1 Tax=Hexamita inflata TaxID=28002 RepID=A0AA86TY68_9EUKA|nr:Hypothetical protein HINF_LOCUS20909 [Hexamita inflata]